MTDPIADYLTRVRNAYLAGKKIVEIPSSKMKVAITKILCEKGYILSYKVKIERVSTPGMRQYVGVDEMPRVLNGLGIAILSTSKGIISDKEAKEQNVGGEVVCYVY